MRTRRRRRPRCPARPPGATRRPAAAPSTRPVQGGGEQRRLRAADADRGVRAEQLVHREVGQQPAAAEHDEVVGGVLHLAHQVAGDQHRPSLVGEVAQQLPHPADALRVQAVHRLVEQQDVGVAEQRGGDAEPLPHAQGEPAHPVVGHRLEADHLDDVVHAAPGQGVALRQREQVRVGGAPGMARAGVDEGADPAHRLGQLPVGAAEHVAVPAVGRVSPRTQRIVVVLPEPLGPRKPVTRPGSTVTVRSSTASRVRYCLVSPSSSITRPAWRTRGRRPRQARPPRTAAADADPARSGPDREPSRTL